MEEEEGRTIKKKNSQFVRLCNKKYINIITMSDFDLIDSYVFIYKIFF